MVTLYNCRHSGDQYRVTKFDDHMNVESSYICTETECDCPAGVRDTCRHRQMLPKFIERKHVGDEWFFDFDRGGWVQMGGEWMQPQAGLTPAPSNYIYTEEDCPGHVASDADPKICGRCGVHIDSLRPEMPAEYAQEAVEAEAEFQAAAVVAKPKALYIRRRI